MITKNKRYAIKWIWGYHFEDDYLAMKAFIDKNAAYIAVNDNEK